MNALRGPAQVERKGASTTALAVDVAKRTADRLLANEERACGARREATGVSSS